MAVAGQKRHFSLDKPNSQTQKRRKFRRQEVYHSSSDESESEHDNSPEPESPENEDEDQTSPNEDGEEVDEDVVMVETTKQPADSDDAVSDSESAGSDSDHDGANGARKKRNDPSAFATSMSKILGSKLTTSKRGDPVLARSKEASAAVKETNEARLEAQARLKIRHEKRTNLDIGRERDILGLDSTEVSTEQILGRERRLMRTAQQGVIRLFNAVLAAQLKGQEAVREAAKQGVVGIQKREQKVNELSKQGFLELIAGGGKK
jgi:fusion and transport protein UGO1